MTNEEVDSQVKLHHSQDANAWDNLAKIERPAALVDCAPHLEEIYDIIKALFLPAVETHAFNIEAIGIADPDSFGHPADVAAFTLRRLQLLYALTRGARTTNVMAVNQLQGALISLRELLPLVTARPVAEQRLLDASVALVSALEAVGGLVGPGNPAVELV